MNVFTLLQLPKTSHGFSEINSTSVDSSGDGSASPLRKVARIDADSDSASASRSKLRQDRVVNIKIVGRYKTKPPQGDDNIRALRNSISILLTRNSFHPLTESYEAIYNRCRLIVCVSNKGEGLYGALKIELEKSTQRVLGELLKYEKEGVEWIQFMAQLIDWFHDAAGIVQSLLTFLDEVYVPGTADALSIKDLAYSLFNSTVFLHPDIIHRLQSNLTEWAIQERENGMDHPNRAAIAHLLIHLTVHGQYTAFESFFLSSTRDYYTHKSSDMAADFAPRPKDFFERAHALIEAEVQRSQAVFPPATWSRIRETTEQAMMTERVDWLAKESVGAYITAADAATDDESATGLLDSLGRMYRLFERVDGTRALCAAWRVHIHDTVSKIVKDTAKDETMVEALLKLKALAERILTESFASTTHVPASAPSTSAPPSSRPNKDFLYALSDAFISGFKSRRNKPAEMLAKHLDKLMRKGQNTLKDKEFEEKLDKVLQLYRFSDDKDVFRTFYHRQLAKRLLLRKSASDDFESMMLKKLKESYDPEFDMGENMFKDLSLSNEMMREYHNKTSNKNANLDVRVLQRSAWPFTVQKKQIILTPPMQSQLNSFVSYYKLKHTARTLDWDHALGTMILKTRFNGGVKELSVSLYQGMILLIFNDTGDEAISFAEMKDHQHAVDDEELRRTLQSLACGKKRVLRKVPPGRDVNDGDVFRFNEDFTDPKVAVHINSIQAKVSVEESKQTNKNIEDDRKHLLDAAIVRIMKAKKELPYEQLKVATIDAVKKHFMPQVEEIKKRVDALVESEYLERSPEDRSIFRYLA